MKYIYLVQSLENGNYKIGVSNNPQRRLNEIQTGNSNKVKLIDYYKSDKYSKIESILHNRYSHFRKNGEWFELPVNYEINFKKECEDIENMINNLEKMRKNVI